MTRVSLASWLLGLRPAQVELLRPRPAVPPLSWILLGLGMALCALGTAIVLPRQALVREQQQELASLQQRWESRPSRPPAVAERKAGEHDPSAEATALLRELQRPWIPLFAALEACDDPQVHLVQLSVDGRFSSLRLLAESRRFDALLHYETSLAEHFPVRSVEMTHHEWRDLPSARVASAQFTADLDDHASADAPGGAR